MTRYRSVERPWLVLAEDDVWECERCDGTGEVVVKLPDYVAFCPDCDGRGLLHGYDSCGRGLPVEEAA